mgnify:CR=1 FL=1
MGKAIVLGQKCYECTREDTKETWYVTVDKGKHDSWSDYHDIYDSNKNYQRSNSFSKNKNIDYTIQDPNTPTQKINLGNTDISFSPDWVVGNTISFTPIDNFQISLTSKYIGERYLTNENQENALLEDFLVHSLHLSYELLPQKLFKSLLFSVTANNLLNKKYVAHGRYASGKPLYFPAAELNSMVGITFTF